MSEALKRTEGAWVSEEDYLAMPESLVPTELIDGELFVSPSPDFAHQATLGRIFRALAEWADRTPPAVVGIAPLDVRIGPSRIVQPDIALWLRGLTDTSTPIREVPDLIIEVLSSNRVHDRVMKRYLYAEAGVRELWLVDNGAQLIERLTGTELRRREVLRGTLESPLLPGLSLDIPALLP